MIVSVIIPTYNSSSTILRAISSVLQQNVSLEIIVVDDGSTDNTSIVLKELNDNITVIKQKNAGPSVARNTGIKASRGEYIAFIDADDEWCLSKLSKQLSIFRKYPEVALVSSTANYIRNKNTTIIKEKIINKTIKGDVLDILLFRNIIVTSSVLVKKTALMELDTLFREDLRMSEDWELWIRIAARHHLFVSNEPLINYYILQNSISNRFKNEHYFNNYMNLYLGLNNDAILNNKLKNKQKFLVSNAHFKASYRYFNSGNNLKAKIEMLNAIILAPSIIKWSTATFILFGSPWLRDKIKYIFYKMKNCS